MYRQLSNYLSKDTLKTEVVMEHNEERKKAEEYLYLISMTVKCKPIGFFEVTHGAGNASMVGIREFLIRALLSGAVNIIIVHNHPSRIPEASEQDLLVTQRLSEASNLIGLQFVEHIIIGKVNYYSFYLKQHVIYNAEYLFKNCIIPIKIK